MDLAAKTVLLFFGECLCGTYFAATLNKIISMAIASARINLQ
jgi:hypothetical protein